MNEKKEYLSKEKYDELHQELDFLMTKRRKEIADQLEYSKSLGDLSENAEYHQARDAQGRVEARIYELQEILKHVELITEHSSERVEVGSTVTVKNLENADSRTFSIVGSEEADTSAGKLSLNSPLGKAMLGKRAKDEFTFTAPSGRKISYKIAKIA